MLAAECQLTELLDEIPYETISGESCAELGGVLPYLEKVVAMLSTVARRETPRYTDLAEGTK